MHRAAVLGKPVAHSLSPVLHRAAYAALGLTDWRYDAYEVDAPGLADFIGGLGPSWRGLSLTMPLKEEALLVASGSSAVALRTGAVNTLLRTPEGWRGENTDVHGIRTALAEAGVAGTERAIVLGSGATARSALAALADLGVSTVVLGVRNAARESTLAQARDHGMTVAEASFEEAAGLAAQIPLVLSTLPAGAADGFAAAAGSVPDGAVWMDAVYAGWPTPLASAGEELGARVVSGLEMLVHQGAEQVRLMTGLEPPVEAMQQAGRAALGATSLHP
ncbi:shikimate dehydrogenase [Calidifontibacter sp. DB0510]|uniref:Shikimate dehydrogenase n=1 Tax=Metallococcus carri TaxID=1656884 RepID=A0A967AYG4_9MICO|nr:shikimate dehydrogenase [Metallococcus carri]NOP37374.1 shikimate dehydrogenase [Calidifontibacter sp. DB2511S]